MFVIGVDFDNTIVDYTDLVWRVARERRLIKENAPGSKKVIRDIIRCLPEGETEWRKLQAVVYGPRIGEAKLMQGVQSFFIQCKKQGSKVYIISHKTEFASSDTSGINLRKSALAWMQKNNFFHNGGFGLAEKDVYFESTREEKINRIKELDCTHFVDDLEETFLEKSFPVNVEKILFAAEKSDCIRNNARVFTDWDRIREYFFNG